jgi:hypothetical protein
VTMTRNDTIDVLKAISAADRRKVTDTDVDLWHACLRDRSRDDCIAAVVQHFQTSEAWCMPVHVLRLAKAISSDRYMRMPDHERQALIAADDSEYERRRRAAIDEG